MRLDAFRRSRHDPIAGDLRQRFQNKQSFQHARMRHFEPRFVDDFIAEEEQVHVQGSSPPPAFGMTVSTA